MTGVTPLPGRHEQQGVDLASSGRTNCPAGGASRTTMPMARVADEVLGHQPARECA